MPEAKSPPIAGLRLFLISFVVLFFEMASIRWLNGSVEILAYFNNLVLISCFLGLGMGCLLARKDIRLLKFFPVVWLVSILSIVWLNRVGLRISYRDDIIFAGNQDYYEEAGMMYVTFAALLSFVFNAVLFAILGQELGKRLKDVRPNLKAYSWDIAGSFIGTITYAALAWTQSPPHVWFGLGSLIILFLLWEGRQSEKVIFQGALCILLCLTFMRRTYPLAFWSPYYKVEIARYQNGKNQNLGYKIFVDNLRIQDALHLGPETLLTTLGPWIAYYELPYHFVHPKKVLILGAGSGNEAVMALQHGVDEIHAVEIDPIIAGLGRWLHPDHPNLNPKVKVFVDDARSFLSKTRTRYDLVVLSALDSHKQIAGMANLRLESFVYTVESFRMMRHVLAPEGVLCLNLSSMRPWMGERVYWSLEKAFGQAPTLFQTKGSPYRSIAYVFGPKEVLSRDLLPGKPSIQQLPPYSVKPRIKLATDDWPYLYLKSNIVPTFCVVVFALAILISIAAVLGVEPKARRPNLHFFFLGAGFMLLETRSITQAALLFGATWNVNAIVIGAIFIAIYIANMLVAKQLQPGRRLCYGLLFLTLVLGYFYPFSQLLSFAMVPRLLLASFVIALPIVWAAFIFSTSYKAQTECPEGAFGANLLGVVVGGSLEYSVNIWGLDALYLVAILLYFASFAFRPDSVAEQKLHYPSST